MDRMYCSKQAAILDSEVSDIQHISGLFIGLAAIFIVIDSLVRIEIQQMSDPEYKVEDASQEPKKTRKIKAKVPTVSHRSTRKAKRKDSSDQCTLPEIIPRNQFNEMVCKQSFQSEITRVILQLPLSSFVGDEFIQTAVVRVENFPVQVRVYREKDNICCGLRFTEEVLIEQGREIAIIIHGKYSWLSDNSIVTKHIKSIRKLVSKDKWQDSSWLKMSAVNSDMFVVLSLRKEQEECEDYLGLVNQGNTCYMNSYLQMLFHLPEFRRLIFAAESKEADKFPATLQMLFYRMMEEEKAVSPEELIRSFGWSKKDAKVQQDVQEFSCLFFDVLERKVVVPHPPGHVANIAELFCGELTHYIQCCHVGTADFRTQNYERFYDLHIPLAPTISQALDDYVGEQTLEGDNRYQTDYYGLQQARKGLIISKLPPILMLQLKRFQYNYFTDSNEKILDQCKFPEQMEFSKWTNDPHTPAPYVLYAVLVHQGSFATSGHYYVYIKTKDSWIKFNDERVEKVTRERALHHNYGGQSETFEYQPKEMKVVFKSIQNKATAYMLVYANKQLFPMLFAEVKPQFPQWLIEQTKYKQSMEQQKKIKKQSICDIPILRWSKHFQGQSIAGMGFAPRDMLDAADEKIEMIPKSQRVGDWLQQREHLDEDKQVYLMWTVQDREVVMNINSKTALSMKQLFSQTSEPYFFFAPISTAKEQFLVVIKLFNKLENELYYHGLTKLKKESQFAELHKLMSSIFPGQENNCYYIEDRKQGVIKITPEDMTLLPASSPARNQLLIVVVQQLEKDEDGGQVLRLYKQEMDTIQVVFKNESAKEDIWERMLNKYVTMEQIRSIIFDEIIKEKDDYQSPRNIVVKYRTKKNSKLLTEAKDTDQLKDIIKHERILHFSFSSLSIHERLTQKQLTFYYRDPFTKKLSDPQTIIVDKNNKDSIIDLICQSKVVESQLPIKKGFGYRLFLLSKDRTYINDIVDQKGYVPGKGELLTVLSREKYSALVVQQFQIPKTDSELINVLIHHVTKTGEKIGIPRWEYTLGDAMLSALKDYVLDNIGNDQIEFEGKTYNVNPVKVRVLAYTKQWSRAEELPEAKEYDETSTSTDATVESRFGKPRYLRIGVVHNQISKTIQALKLNVQ